MFPMTKFYQGRPVFTVKEVAALCGRTASWVSTMMKKHPDVFVRGESYIEMTGEEYRNNFGECTRFDRRILFEEYGAAKMIELSEQAPRQRKAKGTPTRGNPEQPQNNYKPYTEDEDSIIRASIAFGKTGKEIAEYLGNGRTESSIFSRANKLGISSPSRNFWTREKNIELLYLIEVLGKSLKEIAEEFGCTYSAVSSRYYALKGGRGEEREFKL